MAIEPRTAAGAHRPPVLHLLRQTLLNTSPCSIRVPAMPPLHPSVVQLSVWPVGEAAGDEALANLREQLATATVIKNCVAHLPGKLDEPKDSREFRAAQRRATVPSRVIGPSHAIRPVAAPPYPAAATTAATAATSNGASSSAAIVPYGHGASSSAAIVPAAASNVVTAPATGNALGKRKLGPQQSEQTRAKTHQEQLKTSFAAFECKCPLATAAGRDSCLDQFSKSTLTAFYAETYGSQKDGAKKVKLADVSAALHAHMWALKVKLPQVDAQGREYAIPKWTLDGVEVCRLSWQKARGGSDRTPPLGDFDPTEGSRAALRL